MGLPFCCSPKGRCIHKSQILYLEASSPPFMVSPSLQGLLPLPSWSPPPPFMVSSPSLHGLLPLPSWSPPPPFMVSSPSLHGLLPLPSRSPPPPFMVSSPSLHGLLPLPSWSPPSILPPPPTLHSPTSPVHIEHSVLQNLLALAHKSSFKTSSQMTKPHHVLCLWQANPPALMPKRLIR